MIEEECAICLNLLNDNYIITPCNHKYHSKCIMKIYDYVSKKDDEMNCPLCRKNINDIKKMIDYKMECKIKKILKIFINNLIVEKTNYFNDSPPLYILNNVIYSFYYNIYLPDFIFYKILVFEKINIDQKNKNIFNRVLKIFNKKKYMYQLNEIIDFPVIHFKKDLKKKYYFFYKNNVGMTVIDQM